MELINGFAVRKSHQGEIFTNYKTSGPTVFEKVLNTELADELKVVLSEIKAVKNPLNRNVSKILFDHITDRWVEYYGLFNAIYCKYYNIDETEDEPVEDAEEIEEVAEPIETIDVPVIPSVNPINANYIEPVETIAETITIPDEEIKEAIDEIVSEAEEQVKQFIEKTVNTENIETEKTETENIETVEDEKVEKPNVKKVFNKEEKTSLKQGIAELKRFFKEFDFVPSLRFVNTMAYALNQSDKKAIDYITSYFRVSGSFHEKDVSAKIKSPEFKNILKYFKVANTQNIINDRLVMYYGEPGGGKTYACVNECEGRVIVCNEELTSNDLLQDFDFEDGKPTFNRSILREAMENGLTIGFDEINLLPVATLRFLQGLTDNKDEFTYKGEVIKIKKGFKIIGTMNLIVGGEVYGLPEPLVDRCAEIKYFEPTDDMYLNALL